MNYLALVVAFVASILLTPIVKRLAYRIGAVDKPNYRKVHNHVMPRLGGLAIFIAFLMGIVIAQPMDDSMIAILIGSFVIVVTGILDDMFEITPKAKLIGQTIAAAIVIFFGGVQIDFINLPFGGKLFFGLRMRLT